MISKKITKYSLLSDDQREKKKAQNREYSRLHRGQPSEAKIKWLNDNKEILKIKKHQYYLDHADAIKKRTNEYAKAHPEAVKQYSAKAARKWRKNNPDEAKALNERYRKENPELVKAKYKRWVEKHWAEYYERNKEKIQERSRRKQYTEGQRVKRRTDTNKWRTKNRDKVLSYQRQWSNDNRSHVNEYALSRYYKDHEAGKQKNRNQYRRNPDAAIAGAGRYRARKHSVTIENFKNIEIYERDKWICQLCGKSVNKHLKRPDPFSPSLDHIIPLSKDGTHERKNTQLTHLLCNFKKGAKILSQ